MRQFIISLQNHVSDDDEEEVAETVDDVIVHSIHSDDSDLQFEENENKESLFHLAAVESEERPAPLTARLQNAALLYAAAAKLLKKRVRK